MKTSKIIGFLTALMLLISVSGCAPSYYSGNRYGYAYARRHHHGPPPPPVRPYNGNYGYGRPGW